MTDYDFRIAEPDQHRAAHDLFMGAVHLAPVTDEHWTRVEQSFEPGRTFGAFHGDTIVGTTTSWASRLAVPGGEVLPMAAVSRVGVRADHTRRGLLTGLMRAQLGSFAEPVATLRASEGVIYRRFGYGVATRGRSVKIERARAISHADAPAGGHVRLVDFDQVRQVLPEIYRRIGPNRPGWIGRTDWWWNGMSLWSWWVKEPLRLAVHSGPDGDDGFAVYHVMRDSKPRVLEVDDLVAGTPQAWAGLWRFVLTVDLVHEIAAELRPLDEPLEELFTDRRAVRTTDIDDETWLRIVDVPQALAARAFGAVSGQSGRSESVVIEVRDTLLPDNSGRYRIGAGPARPVGEPAELVLDVAALATLYLGDIPPSALAAAGHVIAVKDEAVAAADRLFAVPTSPWCGTYF